MQGREAWSACPDARWMIAEAIRRGVDHRRFVEAVHACIQRAESDEGIGPVLPEELARATTAYVAGATREGLVPWCVLVDDLDAALPGAWTKELAARHRRWFGEPQPGRGLFWAVVVPPFA